MSVSTHSRPKAAGFPLILFRDKTVVSTHSRPKAAGWLIAAVAVLIVGFNTQPPEGGWKKNRGSPT